MAKIKVALDSKSEQNKELTTKLAACDDTVQAASGASLVAVLGCATEGAGCPVAGDDAAVLVGRKLLPGVAGLYSLKFFGNDANLTSPCHAASADGHSVACPTPAREGKGYKEDSCLFLLFFRLFFSNRVNWSLES